MHVSPLVSSHCSLCFIVQFSLNNLNKEGLKQYNWISIELLYIDIFMPSHLFNAWSLMRYSWIVNGSSLTPPCKFTQKYPNICRKHAKPPSHIHVFWIYKVMLRLLYPRSIIPAHGRFILCLWPIVQGGSIKSNLFMSENRQRQYWSVFTYHYYNNLMLLLVMKLLN